MCLEMDTTNKIPLRQKLNLKTESQEFKRTGLKLQQNLKQAKFGKEKEDAWKNLAHLARSVLKSKILNK